jgi:GNAT superfamily N-acetyltransferase
MREPGEGGGGFRGLAELSDAERARIRARLAGHPLFRLYFEAGLDAAARGDHSRSALIGGGDGVVLSIDFDAMTVRTTIGSLTSAELDAACAVARKAELHVEPGHREAALARCAGRVLSDQTLRYYHRPVGAEPDPDRRCRRLTQADYPKVAALFADHYPTTIFSRWMLDDTLIGLFEDGDLVACGGVVARHAGLATVNLGNFLTVPARRGRGLARVVMAAVLASVAADGIRLATLGTTLENRAAWRGYEAAGFAVLEERSELIVAPPPESV